MCQKIFFLTETPLIQIVRAQSRPGKNETLFMKRNQRTYALLPRRKPVETSVLTFLRKDGNPAKRLRKNLYPQSGSNTKESRPDRGQNTSMISLSFKILHVVFVCYFLIFSNPAFIATITVLRLIKTAPAAGLSNIPDLYNTPAANGRAIML